MMPTTPQKITILGASGFIGRHLTAHLRKRGDHVTEGSLRDPASAAQSCAGSDIVVNLAGAPAAARWTAAYKDEIRRSRVDVPRGLIERLGSLPQMRRPKAYISASAVGYYGTSLSATFTEESAPGRDFLADVCVGWEGRRAAHPHTACAWRLSAQESCWDPMVGCSNRSSQRSSSGSAVRSPAVSSGLHGSTSTIKWGSTRRQSTVRRAFSTPPHRIQSET